MLDSRVDLESDVAAHPCADFESEVENAVDFVVVEIVALRNPRVEEKKARLHPVPNAIVRHAAVTREIVHAEKRKQRRPAQIIAVEPLVHKKGESRGIREIVGKRAFDFLPVDACREPRLVENRETEIVKNARAGGKREEQKKRDGKKQPSHTPRRHFVMNAIAPSHFSGGDAMNSAQRERMRLAALSFGAAESALSK